MRVLAGSVSSSPSSPIFISHVPYSISTYIFIHAIYILLVHSAHNAIIVPKMLEPHTSHELSRSIRMFVASPLNGTMVALAPAPVCR